MPWHMFAEFPRFEKTEALLCWSDSHVCCITRHPRMCFPHYIGTQTNCTHGVWNKGLSVTSPRGDRNKLQGLRRKCALSHFPIQSSCPYMTRVYQCARYRHPAFTYSPSASKYVMWTTHCWQLERRVTSDTFSLAHRCTCDIQIICSSYIYIARNNSICGAGWQFICPRWNSNNMLCLRDNLWSAETLSVINIDSIPMGNHSIVLASWEVMYA